MHSPGCRERLSIMIAAYFDESGSHDQADVLTIAGYVSTAERWCRLASEWEKALAPYHLDEFKMKNFAHPTKEFRDWPEHRRMRLFRRLAGIIDRRTLFGFGVGVMRRSYMDVVAPRCCKGDPLSTDPYLFCIHFALEALGRAQRKGLVPDEPIAVFFDDGHKHAGAVDGYASMLKRNPRWQRVVASISLVDSKFPPVQPADMLAYETGRDFKRGIQGPEQQPETFRRLLQAGRVETAYADQECLEKWAQRQFGAKSATRSTCPRPP